MLKGLLLFTALSWTTLLSTQAADDYKLGPDSFPQPGVPAGRVEHFTFTESKIYPGTSRDGWVYVPAQYTDAKPAALMVFQDGHAYVTTNGQMRVPIVFDNLIHRGEMPVTIAVFINPGHRGPNAPNAEAWGNRDNRSFEYDSLGDAYARFLLEELLPFVVEKYHLNITADPELRAICGMSSGGICAFTVAWDRPDQFRKVLSQIGSFTNIRGGNVYPALIRKTERKPLRVFLQDGSNDLNNLFGDWPLANQEMASALRFVGYDYRFEFGDGTHSGKHGGAILPESLRWLWRPAIAPPAPLTAGNLNGDEALSKVLPNDGGWELVGENYGFTDAACGDRTGHFYFSDLPHGRIYRVAPDSQPTVWLDSGIKISGLKFGPDGKLYAATQGTVEAGKNSNKKAIIMIDPESKKTEAVATGVDPNDLVVSGQGIIYFTDTKAGQVLMVPTDSRDMARPRVAAGGIKQPNGISLTADQKFLVVSEYGSSNVWSYALAADGSLRWGERYMTLRTPVNRAESGGDGMTTDARDRIYVTSYSGIQMFDTGGRLSGVIASPGGKGCVSLAFAGPDRAWLYACASDKVFRRKTLTQGALVFERR